MRTHACRVLSILVAVVLVGALCAVPASAAPDSGAGTVWMCRPDFPADPCDGSQDTTVIGADGSQRVERKSAPASAPIDCFYVYPTVVQGPGPNAPNAVTPEPAFVARDQAARFSLDCNVYAPIYRQGTTVGLLQNLVQGGKNASLEVAYDDVLRAWDDYMAHDNNGRGVVLIGHSQGSGMLRGLIRNRIDNNPAVAQKLVSALIIGGNVLVARGSDRGGDFENIPACTTSGQIGCVVAYSSFDGPVPADSIFGRSDIKKNSGISVGGVPAGGPQYQVLCTNPAALGSTAPAALHPVGMAGIAGAPLAPAALAISTPFFEPPAGFVGQCVDEGGANVLQVTPGPGAILPPVLPGAGLHLLDVNLALGDLVDLVANQTRVYLGG